MPYQVYRVLNPTTNKCYIGITSKNYKLRFRHHQKEVDAGSTFIFHNALRKYGVAHFQLSLLETCADSETLKEREKYWIGVFDSANREKGYNMTTGGDGTFGRSHSDETRKKISKVTMGRDGWKRTAVNLTNTLSSETTYFPSLTKAGAHIGLSPSGLSRARKGKQAFTIGDWVFDTFSDFTPKPKERTKYIPTEAQNRKRIDASRQWRKDNPQEAREAMMAGRIKVAKPVDQLTMEGEYIQTFLSSGYAADAVLLPGNNPSFVRTNIRNTCKGKSTSAKGFKWRWSTPNTTTTFTAQE